MDSMIQLEARPRLSARTRLRHDRVRDRWLLLVPERGVVLNASALAIVRCLGHGKTLGEIAASLAEEAGQPSVADQVIAFVGRLAVRGYIEAA